MLGPVLFSHDMAGLSMMSRALYFAGRDRSHVDVIRLSDDVVTSIVSLWKLVASHPMAVPVNVWGCFADGGVSLLTAVQAGGAVTVSVDCVFPHPGGNQVEANDSRSFPTPIPCFLNLRLLALVSYPGVPVAIRQWGCVTIAKVMRQASELVEEGSIEDAVLTQQASTLVGECVVRAMGLWASGGQAHHFLAHFVAVIGGIQLTVNSWPPEVNRTIANAVLSRMCALAATELQRFASQRGCIELSKLSFANAVKSLAFARADDMFRSAVRSCLEDSALAPSLSQWRNRRSNAAEKNVADAFVIALSARLVSRLCVEPALMVTACALKQNLEAPLLALVREVLGVPTVEADLHHIREEKDPNGDVLIREANALVLEGCEDAAGTPPPDEVPRVLELWGTALCDAIAATSKHAYTSGAHLRDMLARKQPKGAIDLSQFLDGCVLGYLECRASYSSPTGDDFEFGDDSVSHEGPELYNSRNPWYSNAASAALSPESALQCQSLSFGFGVGVLLNMLCIDLLGCGEVAGYGGPTTPPACDNALNGAKRELSLYTAAELGDLADEIANQATTPAVRLALSLSSRCKNMLMEGVEEVSAAASLGMGVLSLAVGATLLWGAKQRAAWGAVHITAATILLAHASSLLAHFSASFDGYGCRGGLFAVMALCTLIDRTNQFSPVGSAYLSAVTSVCWACHVLRCRCPHGAPAHSSLSAVEGYLVALGGSSSPVHRQALEEWKGSNSCRDRAISIHLRRLFVSKVHWHAFVDDLSTRFGVCTDAPQSSWPLLAQLDLAENDADSEEELFIADASPTQPASRMAER